jgi:hypothetical protein
MHRKVAAAIVAALALGIASCGGSETTTLSRAELVRRVELACREGQRESQKLARAARDSDGQSGFIDAVLTGQKMVRDRIDGYETSGAAKADFAAFKQSIQARIDAIQRIADADRADQPRAIRALQPQMEAAARRGQDAARSLGLEGCI